MDREHFIEHLDRLASNTEVNVQEFQSLILQYFQAHKRPYPWRETRDPYAILVSELMLQQTQTERVLPKYEAFLTTFPDWASLAAAPTSDVLKMWDGLGYYRRALNLHRAAKVVAAEGTIDDSPESLLKLPGVGPYTAAAVAVFAFGKSVPMIETNIRSVYLHTFFSGRLGVGDKEVLVEIDRTMYHRDPRSWFYALMDAGVALKKSRKGINKRSKHYARQTPFHGSHRQLRAALIKQLTKSPSSDVEAIQSALGQERTRVEKALSELVHEGFLVREGENRYSVSSE